MGKNTPRTSLSPICGVKRCPTPVPLTNSSHPSHSPQTTLPPFKQLDSELYLLPQHMSSEHLSSYPYSGTLHYVPHTGQHQQQESATLSQIVGAPQRDAAMYDAGDSEIGHHSPPKKKRRRQVLSCTGDYFTVLIRCPLPLTVLRFLSITCILINFGSLDFVDGHLLVMISCLGLCDWHHGAC